MSNTELRRNFIAMLFALVLATLAQQFASLIAEITNNWSVPIYSKQILVNLRMNDGLLAAALTHGSLGILLVSASWVGWSKSITSGSQQAVDRFVSWSYLLLLIEVILVTLYFGIAVSIESTDGSSSNASAVPEAIQLATVYSVFLLWDFLADVMSKPLGARSIEGFTLSRWHRCINYLTGTLTFGLSSIICIVLCLIIYETYPADAGPIHAIYGDFALISVVGIFYATKPLEAYMIKLFPWEGTRSKRVRDRALASRDIVCLLFPALFYILFTVLLWNTTLCPQLLE